MDDGSAPKRTSRPGVRKSSYWKKKIESYLNEHKEDVTTYGRLDPHRIFKTVEQVKHFYSGHDVHPSRLIDNENFARWVIHEALQEYQPEISFQVTGEIMQGQSVTIGRSVPKKLVDAILADGQREIDAEDPNGSKNAESDIVQDVSAVAQALVAASPNSLGPPIKSCVSYLRMERCGKFGRNNLTVWKSPLFPQLDGEDGRKGLLDNQITGIAWIMSRFLGELPRLKLKLPHLWNKKKKIYTQEKETKTEWIHRKRLRGPRYSGAILADSMGLGKTLTTIACLDILASQRLNVEKGKDDESIYRPILILAPNNIVASQWVDEIEQLGSSRSIKQIIISGDGAQKKEDQPRTDILSVKQFREWPDSLSYVWDESKYEAAKTVIVMSIDTWARRTCMSKAEGGKTEWWSTFTKMGRGFSIVVVDEAYKIRHTSTRYYKSVALLKRQFTLLITATPCLNLLTDLMGPVRLLWPNAESFLQRNKSRWEKISQKFTEPQDLRVLDDMDPWDDHHLIAGRPSIVSKLISRSKGSSAVDIQETRKLMKHFESLAILRRAPSSNLNWDWKGTEQVSLEGLLPNVDNFTVNIQLDHALEEAYQEAHIDILMGYLDATKNWKKAKPQKRTHRSVLTSYLQFELAAASIDVLRLEKLLSLNGFGAKAEHVKKMRENNVNFMLLANFLLEPDDPRPKVALDYVKLAVRKSPVLRYILQYVKENVLNRGPNEKIKKLLITESRPILAYFYELVLQFLLVHCRTLHAGLTGQERRELIASFNDDDDHSCQILIQMYSVGFAGSNLHKNCAQVLVASQAHSLPVQWQAIHRVIRVGQSSDVKVYRLKVNNSYHEFCESRQVEKILPELGTRAQGPMIGVLVQLLNLFQYEIDEAWKTPEARELMEDMNLLADEEEEKKGAEEEQEGEEDEEGEPAAKRLKLNGLGSGVKIQKHRPKRIRDEGMSHLFDDDYEKFLLIKPRAAYYDEFKKFPSDVRSHFSHKKNNHRRLLSYGKPNEGATTRVWTAEDLNKSAVLERAMELMLRVRLGAKNIEMLPQPQINFMLVSEWKLERLTMLLGKAKFTAQDIDKSIREKAEARARRIDSRELRALDNNLSLAEIDAAFMKDVTSGDTNASRTEHREAKKAAKAAEAANDDVSMSDQEDDAANDEAANDEVSQNDQEDDAEFDDIMNEYLDEEEWRKMASEDEDDDNEMVEGNEDGENGNNGDNGDEEAPPAQSH
ncbi:SNF2 family N-terminal domain-containing protein [Annulohypoxylon bovei var. microspora]|nr:SNF2 family N-terminal domain-containing protein [Annulohypoxylon bovei var. microspora]